MAEWERELTYDLMDFNQRDEVDAEDADDIRATVSGLPARPGTRR